MVVNFIPDSVDPQSLRNNQQAMANHVDDLYFTRRLTPGMFVPFGGAALGTAGQSVGLGKWPTIDYPDAASSYAVCAFERPQFWVSGRHLVAIYYTSQTAGTANFNLLVVLNTVKGSATTTGNLSNTGITNLLSTSVAVPGPVVADDERFTLVYTTTSINPSARRIGIRIGRDGAGDINNNVLQVTEVVIKHIPARQTVNA